MADERREGVMPMKRRDEMADVEDIRRPEPGDAHPRKTRGVVADPTREERAREIADRLAKIPQARHGTAGDSYRRLIVTALLAFADEVAREEREECCEAVCYMCAEGNPPDAHLCRAAAIRARSPK